MKNSSAISHKPLQDPDFLSIALLPPQRAADALKSILRAWEVSYEEVEVQYAAIKERIFNIRMCCFRIVSDRELWKLDTDPEYGIPYKSMARWIQVLFPKEDGLRYAIEANSTQAALPAATVKDLSEMKRCNAVLLASASVSDTCRTEPGMIEATKTATEKDFRERLNKEHGQHLEAPETLKFTYPKGDAAQVKAYLRWVAGKAELADLDDYPGALLYLAIHENEEHQEAAA
jgi:hypothetical protein